MDRLYTCVCVHCACLHVRDSSWDCCDREQERECLFDHKNVYVVHTVDRIDIIKIIWSAMTSHVNIKKIEATIEHSCKNIILKV